MLRFPYKMLTLPDGSPLAFVDEGTGPTLLMLHGYTGTAHRHFSGLIAHFRSSYRVIAPDLRGYGASQPPPRDFPVDYFERDAEDAARLLDVIAAQESAILGFSDGGETALILAARRPDLARGLVIWGTFGCIPPSVMNWINTLIPVDSWPAELASWRDAIIEHHGQAQWPGLVTSFVQTARVLAEAGWDAPLQHAKSILCPVLQLHGELEERANATEVAQLASAIPNCRMQVIAGADHSLQLEKPEEFTSLVRSFLLGLDESTGAG